MRRDYSFRMRIIRTDRADIIADIGMVKYSLRTTPYALQSQDTCSRNQHVVRK